MGSAAEVALLFGTLVAILGLSWVRAIAAIFPITPKWRGLVRGCYS
jgi:hypothetical protein